MDIQPSFSYFLWWCAYCLKRDHVIPFFWSLLFKNTHLCSWVETDLSLTSELISFVLCFSIVDTRQWCSMHSTEFTFFRSVSLLPLGFSVGTLGLTPPGLTPLENRSKAFSTVTQKLCLLIWASRRTFRKHFNSVRVGFSHGGVSDEHFLPNSSRHQISAQLTGSGLEMLTLKHKPRPLSGASLSVL